jgi:predicted anti-sigma-YlaC factor YlaD
MTCREYEPLIALYVEGDLVDQELERHLAECSDCREVLEDLRVSQAALKELSVVDAAFLSAVRSGVLARIERRRRSAWPWVAALAAALIVAVLMPPRKPALIAKAPVSSDGAVRDLVRPAAIAQGAP